MKNISKTNTHRPPKNTQIDFFREFFGKSLFFPYISRRNRDFKNIFDNRRALTNEEKAILIKLGKTLKERVQGNDDEEEEG